MLKGAAMGLLLAFGISVAALAVVEYLAHRLVMHHECAGPLRATFDRHAVQHHRLRRLDINIDAPAWFYLAIGSPALACLAASGRWGELVVSAATIACYAWLWTGVHRASHDLGGKWATYLPIYPALRRHHLAHHATPGRNFGTVFGPLLDIPMGTWSGIGPTRPAATDPFIPDHPIDAPSSPPPRPARTPPATPPHASAHVP